MRCRIELPEHLRSRTPVGFVEPRHDWHARECTRLAYGVFRFDEDPPSTYHLLNDKFLKPVSPAE